MNREDFHLAKNEKLNIVYKRSTSDIMVVNDITFHILDLWKNGVVLEEIMNKYEPYKDSIYTFMQSLEASQSVCEETVLKQPMDVTRRIHRITLHVSNDCNLRCKYCYAGGGSYNRPRNIMSLQTAKAFVDFCEKTFDHIDIIVFFGGEPMLNMGVMEFICNQFKRDYNEGRSLFLPSFGIITNGTILTPRIFRFIKENISIITVSIDGLQEMNDVNRVYRNGKGSYAKIAEFIHAIHEIKHVKMQFEATFTQSHADRKYRIKDISYDLENEFGIRGFVMSEDGLEPGFLINYLKTIEYDTLIETDFDDLPVEFWLVLRAIVHKESFQFCPIIKDIFAVNSEGLIFPCHMLTGAEISSLGSIDGVNVFNEPLWYTSFNSKLHGKENEKCKSCWAEKLCGGCTFKKFYSNEKEDFVGEPQEKVCELTKQYLEQILLVIAIIRKESTLWSALVKKEKEHRYFC